MSPLLLAALLAAAPAPLTLEQAEAQARAHQPSLRQAQAAAQAATARARESLSPLLPQVSLGLGYSRATSNYAPRPGAVPSSVDTASTLSLSSYDYFSGSLTVSQTLWDFGKSWNRYQASLSQADAQASAVHTARVAALLAVRSAFFQAAAQRDLVAVAQATLDNAEAHLAQVQGFVRAGSRPEIDLAQSRADRANARLALVNARNAYALARARLNQAMGVEGPTDYEVAEAPATRVDGEDQGVEAVLPEALAARPDLKALDAQLRAQQLSLRGTRDDYWPTLGAQLGANVGARTLDSPVPNLSGQLTLSWALYEGGLTRAQVDEAAAALAQLEAQRDALTAQVRLDVEQALLGVKAARESVEVAGEANEAAQEQLRLAEGRYKAGAGSVIELGDAQVRATTAASQRVQAVFSLATARAQLLAALGRE